MIPYRIHPAANAEFAIAVRYYQAQSPDAGARFVEAVERAISLIREFPEIGSPTDFSLRRARVQRFPFAVVYEFDGQFIYIQAIADLRRRPDYWHGRM